MYINRSSGCQPVGRRVRQRPPVTRLRQKAYSTAGPIGRPALRHIPTAFGFTRVRVENLDQILRNWFHTTGFHRRRRIAKKQSEYSLFFFYFVFSTRSSGPMFRRSIFTETILDLVGVMSTSVFLNSTTES